MDNQPQPTQYNYLSFFLIDDHALILDMYINMVEELKNPNETFNFVKAVTFDEANQKLNALQANKINLDLAFIDLSLGPQEKSKTGGDVVRLIKDLFPHCTIIIITAFTDPSITYNLTLTTDIDIIFCKSDLNHESFAQMLTFARQGQHYLSETIKTEFNLITQRRLGLDHHDIAIIQCLSKGIKTKDLPEHVPLSLSAIEKRKAYLISHFSKGTDNKNNFLINIKKWGLL